MGPHRAKALIALLVLGFAAPAVAQRQGWSYSPLPGEGDRATLGCALDSDETAYACLAVRCEDDFSVGLYVHTSRPQGDAGPWAITVDKEERVFTATPDDTPYGARLAGDTEWLFDNLRHGAIAYLHPGDGAALQRNSIPLTGSLYAINAALAWCAPRVPALSGDAADPNPSAQSRVEPNTTTGASR